MSSAEALPKSLESKIGTLDSPDFRAVLDALPMPVYATDREGIITYFNQAAADFAGREPRLGKDRWCISWELRRTDGSNLPHDQCPMAQTLKEGRAIRGHELVVVRPDGTMIPVLPYPTPIFDKSGTLTGAINLLVDISERKGSETILRTKTERLEALGRIAKTLSSDLDLEHIIQTVTDSATKLSGAKYGAFFYRVTDEAGEHFQLYTLSGAPRAAFERLGLPRNTALFAATFRGHGVVRSDDIRKHPQYGLSKPHLGMPPGHLPIVSYLAVPVISRSGDVLGGLFLGHDEPGVFSTESEDAVEALAAHAAIAIDNAHLLLVSQREAESHRRAEQDSRYLAAIVESSDDAIISKDLNSIITSWNNGAERLFGYTADEVIGKPITILMPPGHENEEPRILERIRSGARVDHYETKRQRKDGSLVDISLTVSPVRNATGRVIGASKIARNITERKQAEETMEKRLREQASLYQLTEQLHRAKGIEEVYDAALDAIRAALNCSRASILLFDQSDRMRFVAWRGLSDHYRRAVEGHSPWTPEAQDPDPIFVEDVTRAELSDELRATIASEGIAALGFIPLITEGRLVGKFMAYYDRPHVFVETEISLALTIARQLGFSIQRIRAERARQLAEEQLRRNEANERARAAELQAIMEAVPTPIWITRTSDCRVIDGNKSAYDLLHLPPDSNLSFSAPPDEQPSHFRIFSGGRMLSPDEMPVQRAARGEEVENFEEEIRFDDGTSRHLLGNATPLRNPLGEQTGAVAAFVDITERKQAEEALLESERRLKMALDAGRMGAWEWDLQTGRVIWSPGLEKLHRVDPGTFEGTFAAFKRDIHPADLAAVEQAIEKALETREDYHVAYRILLADGTIRWMEAFGRFSPADGGTGERLAGICMDITERKEAEAQRDLLVAELSHRVKNTLATVNSIARQSFSTNPDAHDAQRSFDARIRALAQTHTRLAESRWSGVSLQTIFSDELAPYRNENVDNISLDGPPTTLPPKHALTLGMAAHELATNAAKHGALSVKAGRVSVDWVVDPTEKRLRIRWIETGGPSVSVPTRNGFGRLLLERVLASDLGGDVRLEFASQGLNCAIDVPYPGGTE
ncbi:PAS domain S-box protein [Sinorhizobium sp. 8-89]|uniref:PAS domain S-box protein n=1 Tax=Sinorhizobium sp. 7-81 TaxID=3049087 RepID=UPI0024C28A35|nr:PAS domain S-box protein [Sinorhizobium sp. 7-81]MDK1387856.1 PAS domain S-box protein [Sinorhizobium sp. 7-81]